MHKLGLKFIIFIILASLFIYLKVLSILIKSARKAVTMREYL